MFIKLGYYTININNIIYYCESKSNKNITVIYTKLWSNVCPGTIEVKESIEKIDKIIEGVTGKYINK